MKGYEVLEHTADVGIKAWGETLNSAFENAACGMFSIITDCEKVNAVGEYMVDITAGDIEQLLVDWLSELLYIHSVKGIMFSKFQLRIEESEEGWQLKGHVQGEAFNDEKHPYHTEIKAVTHHMLKIEKDEGYKVQVLFDI